MFSLLPLQLATNIFVAETAEDLERYYGFDKLSAPVCLCQEPCALLPGIVESRAAGAGPGPPPTVRRVLCGAAGAPPPRSREPPLAALAPGRAGALEFDAAWSL
jgi:hypothetical protein